MKKESITAIYQILIIYLNHLPLNFLAENLGFHPPPKIYIVYYSVGTSFIILPPNWQNWREFAFLKPSLCVKPALYNIFSYILFLIDTNIPSTFFCSMF